jgi:hypothetical protein
MGTLRPSLSDRALARIHETLCSIPSTTKIDKKIMDKNCKNLGYSDYFTSSPNWKSYMMCFAAKLQLAFSLSLSEYSHQHLSLSKSDPCQGHMNS